MANVAGASPGKTAAAAASPGKTAASPGKTAAAAASPGKTAASPGKTAVAGAGVVADTLTKRCGHPSTNRHPPYIGAWST
jgi:hypothetical protein